MRLGRRGEGGRPLLVAPLGAALALVGSGLVAVLAAGCGGSPPRSFPATSTATTPAATTAIAKPPLPPVPPPAARPAPPPTFRLALSVVDGDTGKPVAGARVNFGTWSRVVGTRGLAALRVRRPRTLPVVVSASGYERRALALPFARARQQRVLLYRTAAQWPMYGVDAARTQASYGIHLRPPFRIVWTKGLASLLEFPAVVSDGVAYIAGYDGIVHALSMRNGAELWRYTPPNGKSASSPSVWGELLVVHDMRGRVTLLDRATGKVRWLHDVGSPIESSPIVLDGVDVFGTWDGRVIALDLRTRRTTWVRYLGWKITSSVAAGGGLLAVGDYAGRLYALAPKTGAVRWQSQVNGRIYGAPAIAGGRVFVPSSTGSSLTAFALADGRQLWRRYAGSYVYSSAAVWGGRVLFGSYDGQLRCVLAATGDTCWTVGAGGPISGAVVVVGGIAYAGSFAHRILGVDVATGRTLLDFPHGEYVPVSGNGGRLLFHGYSRVFAVEPAR
jgi:outer membrane protein assembly factor BamB